MNTRINEFLVAQDNQTISFNKDIIMTDLVGNQEIIVKCYCTIISGKSISYHMTVENEEIFTANKDAIQVEIDKYKADALTVAQNNNVPII